MTEPNRPPHTLLTQPEWQMRTVYRTIKLECWQEFIVFAKRHLNYLFTEFTSCYNTRRAHIERHHLTPIRHEPQEVDALTIDQIEIKSFVGGLVKSFERKAA